MTPEGTIVPFERIAQSIFLLRGHKVMLDSDLAAMYGVSTRRLNEQVTRNLDRFPEDFMFRLTEEEAANLKSHFATSSWGGRRKKPRAFAEQGVAMLSSVLRNKRAVQVNVEIMRAFVCLRRMVASNAELTGRIDKLEEEYDARFRVVFQAIRELMKPPEKPGGKIGFRQKEDD